MKLVFIFFTAFLFFTLNAFAKDVVVPGEGGKPAVILGVDDSQLAKQVSYEWGKDPFYKTPGFVKGSLKEPTLELKGIVLSDENIDNSSAIINRKTVHVNSMIEGYAVREIGDNYVVVQKGETLRELQLNPIQNKVQSDINVYDRLPAMEHESKSGVGK